MRYGKYQWCFRPRLQTHFSFRLNQTLSHNSTKSIHQRPENGKTISRIILYSHIFSTNFLSHFHIRSNQWAFFGQKGKRRSREASLDPRAYHNPKAFAASINSHFEVRLFKIINSDNNGSEIYFANNNNHGSIDSSAMLSAIPTSKGRGGFKPTGSFDPRHLHPPHARCLCFGRCGRCLSRLGFDLWFCDMKEVENYCKKNFEVFDYYWNYMAEYKIFWRKILVFKFIHKSFDKGRKIIFGVRTKSLFWNTNILLQGAAICILIFTRKQMRSSLSIYLAGLSFFDLVLLLMSLLIYPSMNMCLQEVNKEK